MYVLQKDGKIIGYSTSQTNESYVWTDEEIVEVGNNMFFASQTEEIEKAQANLEAESKMLEEELKKQEEIKHQQEDLQKRIKQLKAGLASTDYKCLKFVDGALTEDEYAETRAYRAELRRQINELESGIAVL